MPSGKTATKGGSSPAATSASIRSGTVGREHRHVRPAARAAGEAVEEVDGGQVAPAAGRQLGEDEPARRIAEGVPGERAGSRSRARRGWPCMRRSASEVDPAADAEVDPGVEGRLADVRRGGGRPGCRARRTRSGPSRDERVRPEREAPPSAPLRAALHEGLGPAVAPRGLAAEPLAAPPRPTPSRARRRPTRPASPAARAERPGCPAPRRARPSRSSSAPSAQAAAPHQAEPERGVRARGERPEAPERVELERDLRLERLAHRQARRDAADRRRERDARGERRPAAGPGEGGQEQRGEGCGDPHPADVRTKRGGAEGAARARPERGRPPSRAAVAVRRQSGRAARSRSGRARRSGTSCACRCR